MNREGMMTMLNQPTIEKLYGLKLGAMASAYQEQQKDAQVSSLSFEERFAMLVDAEHVSRDNRKIKALLKDAELRIADACLEDVDASASRGIDKAMLRQLQSCAWVDQNLNVLITGMTGTGKSYLACALGQTACRRGLRVCFRRVPRLFEELALAKADGTYTKALRKLGRAQLLILDDLGLGSPTEAQRHDLLEVLEDRYGARATVVTSQLPRESWHEWVGDPTVAAAILDRLVHNAYKLDLQGPSRRKTKP
jgi:DNA replication protein DnaC